ncbi:hypothetical protein EJ06DRAFT_480342 [Trichodelitschia bisporula]|uniref:VPS9 domain-containing protein n=1 Tax=Trichodelitschia bisporula TaxID=703511 RepID=A0A6G1HRF6_9PEZI|nr:hypothetical protein EJ06DRAFT_480342 [Trichodelitschia bisporula]
MPPVPDVKVPESLEELPIEIRSFTERFLESLSAKVHPSPLSIDALSDLFQDFYTRADSHIAAHIATLSSRISREKSPTASLKGSSRGAKDSQKNNGGVEQQMLTASEISDRKKARKALEVKKTVLEEAVERTVCEKVYDRVWRHRSSEDEEKDQKLRSRIAALSLIGIGLKELLVGAEDITDDIRRKTVEEQDRIRLMLQGARDSIQAMDAEHHPLGKLHHLTAAHKSIVETLSQLFPSTSSADEILPTLIYALITSPPDTINVISNLNFITRFRAAGKVDGEAAYCLVNLEAAISFLETVDLASLRADESLAGPGKPHPSRPVTPTVPMQLGILPASVPGSTSPSTLDVTAKPPSPTTTKSQRRLSSLLTKQTNRLEAAGDSLRGAVLDSADQAFDTINSTLDASFSFLFGRLREQARPRTLADAAALVSPRAQDDDAQSSSSAEPTTEPEPPTPAAEGRLEPAPPRRAIRDRSADSTTSATSTHTRTSTRRTTETPPLASPASAVESMRTLGSSLNPLSQFSKISFFGRGSSPVPPSAPVSPSPSLVRPAVSPSPALVRPGVMHRTPADARAVAAIEELKRMSPPAKKFVECRDAKELRVGEVEELLREFQRLVQGVGRAVGS